MRLIHYSHPDPATNLALEEVLLDEVEKVCSHVAILKMGSLITTGPVEEVLMDEDIVEMSAADLPALAAALNSWGHSVTADEKTNTVQVILPKGTASLETFNRQCFEKGVVLNHLLLKKKRLEARFFELTNN